MFGDVLREATLNPAPGSPADFGEAAAAAWRLTRQQRLSMSADSQLFDAYEGLRDDLAAAGAPRLFNPYSVPAPERPAAEARFFEEYDRLREKHGLGFASPQELRLRVAELRREQRGEAAGVSRRATGFFPSLGEFAGVAGASIVDPPTLMTMAFPAMTARNLLVAAAKDAGIAAASEVPTQLSVQLGRRQFGERADWAEAGESVAGAGAGGFLISSLIRGTAAGVRRLRRGESEAVRVPDDAPTEVHDSAAFLARKEALEASDPFLGPAGRAEHAERLSAAQRALQAGEAVDLPPPRSPVSRDALRPGALTPEGGEAVAAVQRLAAEQRAAMLDIAAQTESQKAAVLSLAHFADDPARLAQVMGDIVNVGRAPESLLDFIVSKGGLRNDSELAAIGLTPQTRPGIIREKGLTLDGAREAAAEMGFIEHGGYISELLDLLEDSVRGRRVVRPGDEMAIEEHLARKDLLETLQGMGLDPARTSPEAMAQALREAAARLDQPDLGHRARAAESRAVDYEAEERAALANEMDEYVARQFDELAEDVPFAMTGDDGNVRRLTVAEAKAEMKRDADDLAALNVCVGGARA